MPFEALFPEWVWKPQELGALQGAPLRQQASRDELEVDGGGDTAWISSSNTGASTTGVLPSEALKGAREPNESVGGEKFAGSMIPARLRQRPLLALLRLPLGMTLYAVIRHLMVRCANVVHLSKLFRDSPDRKTLIQLGFVIHSLGLTHLCWGS